MQSKTYLKILCTFFCFVFLSIVLYIFYFIQYYPIPITNRASFDAKLKFIREEIDIDAIDTLIIGSSVGLNNVQGAYLEKYSSKCKHVLNLSVHGAYTRQAQQLLELSDAFPNLKRIIYASQYTDFGITHQFKNYDSKFLMRYIRHELNPIEEWLVLFRACNNIFFCIERQKTWKKIHQDKNSFHYISYDSTGSVPMELDGKKMYPGRWSGAQPGNIMPEISYGAVYAMAKKAKDKGINFYFIQQGYRKEIVERDSRVKNALKHFATRIRKIMKDTNGNFLSLYETLPLDDTHFADRNHFNAKGSRVSAEEIAKFIDQCEKNLIGH
jgi:hypothetical protein